MLEIDSKSLLEDHREAVGRIDKRLAQCATYEECFAIAKNLVTDCAQSLHGFERLKVSKFKPAVQ